MQEYHFLQRRAGVLLHPTSLPSRTLDDAYRWLDFMAESGLSVWQVLPLGKPQAGLSPYQCLSAFAANPALLSNIPPAGEAELAEDAYQEFCRSQAHWLIDFALFTALKRHFDNLAWFHWPARYRDRDSATLIEAGAQFAEAMEQVKWQQFVLHREWQSIRRYAAKRGIHLFGDMPIFVAHDSADVWACQERFLLDDQGMAIQVTGVPPDYFSETGQRWGNPHYDWEYMEQEGFRWWLDRLHHHFDWFDLVRIDHFRGLEAVWMIYADSDTAIDGYWQEVPGDKLLAMLQKEMGEIPLVAEDLGIITDEVRALKKRFRLPGMSVLQFSFDSFADNPHKPANIKPNTVVYTGTHDNDTTLGWFRTLDPGAQQYVLETLGIESADEVVGRMTEIAMSCAAALAIIPLQDFLELGSEARMNLPGTTENNWNWAFNWSDLDTPELCSRIRARIDASDRTTSGNPSQPAPSPAGT